LTEESRCRSSLPLFNASVPLVLPRPAAWPTARVPALNVVPLLYVFAPVSVKVPAPALVNVTAPPPIAPPTVKLF